MVQNSWQDFFNKHSWVNWVILLVVVGGLGMFFYKQFYVEAVRFEMGDEVDVWGGDRLPKGVTIVEENEKKVIKDLRNKVNIDLKDDWDLLYANQSTLLVGQGNRPEGETNQGFEFSSYAKTGDESDMDEWVLNWIKNSNCPSCYPDIIKMNDNTYKVVDRGALGEIIIYFFSRNERVYSIAVFDNDIKFQDVLKYIHFDS